MYENIYEFLPFGNQGGNQDVINNYSENFWGEEFAKILILLI